MRFIIDTLVFILVFLALYLFTGDKPFYKEELVEQPKVEDTLFLPTPQEVFELPDKYNKETIYGFPAEEPKKKSKTDLSGS